MTTASAIRILDNHSMHYRFESGVLMVEEVYTQDGEPFSNWIPCPASYRDLMFWLGY